MTENMLSNLLQEKNIVPKATLSASAIMPGIAKLLSGHGTSRKNRFACSILCAASHVRKTQQRVRFWPRY
jgi:hypothetical protein